MLPHLLLLLLSRNGGDRSLRPAGVFKEGTLFPLCRFKGKDHKRRGNRKPLLLCVLFWFLFSHEGEKERSRVASSSQAPYHSLPANAESSFATLLLLFRQNQDFAGDGDTKLKPKAYSLRCRSSFAESGLSTRYGEKPKIQEGQ